MGTHETFHIQNDSDPINGKLLAFCRVFAMNEKDITHWLAQEHKAAMLLQKSACGFVSKELDLRALEFLKKRLQLHLMLLTNTAESDLKKLEGDFSFTRKMCVRVRLLESELLMNTLRCIETAEKYIEENVGDSTKEIEEKVDDSNNIGKNIDDSRKETEKNIGDTNKETEKHIDDSSKKTEKNIEDPNKEMEKIIEDSNKKIEKNIGDSSKEMKKNIADSLSNGANDMISKKIESIKIEAESKPEHNGNKNKKKNKSK